jgi:hypothetical protein
MPNEVQKSNEFHSRAAGAACTDLDLNHLTFICNLDFGIWHSDLGAQSKFAQHQHIGFNRAPSV